MTVEIRETAPGGPLADFLNVVDYIYRDDPCYVRPLDMDMKDRLSPKAPFYEHGEATIFTAYRNGWCVGRCTAQIDRLHLERYQEDVGFFGFFDTVEDQDVATALLRAAEAWLKDRGMTRIRGPLSLTFNDQAGCLIDGFDTPPMIMMQHARPYQGPLIEGAGFESIKELYAWKYIPGEVSKRVQKAHDAIEAMPEVKSRNLDPKHTESEIRRVMDIYNDAWSDLWGHVPFTETELKKMAADMKLILMPEITYITEIDGEDAAVAFAVPNLNELIRDLDGKLFEGPFGLPVIPYGLAKVLYRLKVEGPKSARLIILGIKKKFRQQRKYAGLSLALYAKLNRAGERLGIRESELSWTDSDNAQVNAGIKMMGGKVYKRYRIYEKEIG